MLRSMRKLLVAFVLASALAIPAFAQHRSSHSSSSTRIIYGGGKHTTSHGGAYLGGSSGSSHKGGHYKNSATGNHYGKHKP